MAADDSDSVEPIRDPMETGDKNVLETGEDASSFMEIESTSAFDTESIIEPEKQQNQQAEALFSDLVDDFAAKELPVADVDSEEDLSYLMNRDGEEGDPASDSELRSLPPIESLIDDDDDSSSL